ncbi:phosphotransferase [Frankia sp. Cppng1_Ct_nod]|uniref:phosphotransferase n=1 Tax=Frankia sp. Cppng1_Ct_nod TaxID=2897162 RepID=UPI0013EF821A|nr:phosphotransferase [Frankia sp. Cppng1_Ct_nod]
MDVAVACRVLSVSRSGYYDWLGRPPSLRGQAHDPADATGKTLVHADLHAGNLLIADHRAFVIDWALASHAAPWVDAALLAPRLIAAGHTSHATHVLLESLPVWQYAPWETIFGLAATLTLFREYEARYGPPRLRTRRKQVADAGHTWLRTHAG